MLYSPLQGRLLNPALPALSVQVRGKKQFGGSTRDPFKSLQRKLARQHQRRHAKVPLVSEERAQMQRIAPVTISSVGRSSVTAGVKKTRVPFVLVLSNYAIFLHTLPFRSIGCPVHSAGKIF